MYEMLEKICWWYDFFVKLGTINCIITKLNSFDDKIQFTFEDEDEGTLPFL